MPTKLTNPLPCSIFGHNLKLSKSKDGIDTYRCTSCDSKITKDNFGMIEELPSQNKEVHQTLRQLFLLNRLKRRIISAA